MGQVVGMVGMPGGMDAMGGLGRWQVRRIGCEQVALESDGFMSLRLQSPDYGAADKPARASYDDASHRI